MEEEAFLDALANALETAAEEYVKRVNPELWAAETRRNEFRRVARWN